MKPIRILIAEDTEDDFTKMKNGLEYRFGSQVEVFPSKKSLPDSPYFDWETLIEKLVALKFDDVMDKFRDIDLFVIDINLDGNKGDGTGLKFKKYLEEKYQGSKIIIVSEDIPDESDDPEYLMPISKPDTGVIFIAMTLAERVGKLFKLNEQKSTREFSLTGEEIEEKPYKEKRGLRIRYRIRSFLDASNENIKYVIDKVILLMFYCLLTVTVLSAGYNIGKDFIPSFIYNSNKVEQNVEQVNNGTAEAKSEDNQYKDTMILTKVEHIFLYLLPIFIVFGFYNYYITNAKRYFIQGNRYRININEVLSTRAMNLTKVLFIGSIISYVLIKLIEIIFEKKVPGETNEIFYIKLGAGGLLVLMLMIYFVYLDKHNHSKDGKKE